MIGLITGAISGIFGIGKQYLQNKAEEKQAIHERKITTIKQDGNWDEIQAKNSGESWKDEWLTIIVTLPFIAVFLGAVFDQPYVIENIKAGFEALKESVPEYYWYLLGIVFAASFGVKKVIDGLQKLRGDK